MWLSEDICKLILRGDWNDKMIADKMTINLDVFSPFMVSNMNDTLVITIKMSSREYGHT